VRYSNGEIVHLGDTVKLWDGAIGKVVCSIDTSEYSEEYPKTEWEYLGSGVLVESPEAGLIHYLDSDPELTLIGRTRHDL
jgi:hypothetical protein